jgi:DNA-directed RNA polymerase beta subunit
MEPADLQLLTDDDIFLAFETELEEKSLIYHHIVSANDLYEVGISQIIEQVFEVNIRVDDIRRETAEEKKINHVEIKVNFSDVKINKPSTIHYTSGREEIIFPNTARVKNKTYKAIVTISAKAVATAFMQDGSTKVIEQEIKNLKICKIPIMVGSKWCNTYGLTKETLERLNEDSTDPGGYFIIKGIEWVIDNVENVLFNKVRIFKNEGYKKETMRAEFTSKPGDFYLNSDQFIVRWLKDGQLTIEMRREKLEDLHIPFYLLFRILGWSTDKEIYDNILFDYTDSKSKFMIQYLETAFEAKYNHLSNGRYIYTQHDALQYVAKEIADTEFHYLDVHTYPENYQKITNFILDSIDTHFLQHMGTTLESRYDKLRFLCLILRKIFLVKLKSMDPTDRDSYNSKRIASAGVSFAKAWKTYFNAIFIQALKRRLQKDAKTISFSMLDMANAIRNGVNGVEFERILAQVITVGNKSDMVVNNQVKQNRLSSQGLSRKNQLSSMAALRQVVAPSSNSSKQSERAMEMRMVHPSAHGYIDPTHATENEKVGLNKQLALFAFITKASFSELIKKELESDEDIILLKDITYKEIGEQSLANIFVNGMWIGCCKDSYEICWRYRQKRRRLEISPEVTIVWDGIQNEVYFWTDAGRVIRPLLIVYNSVRDADFFKSRGIKSKHFTQTTALTKQHIKKLYSKEITAHELLKDGAIEYISAEEQENLYLAVSIDVLKQNQKNELRQFTHCDTPRAIVGLTTHTSPFAAHNQTQRVQYQTSQSRQTCGIPALNWPFRTDKDLYLQYNNEMPIVKTLTNRYLHPNGSNCIVAIMCNTGYNQEDSLIINKGAVERGLFNGSKFTYYVSELEHREEFANPDITNTLDVKTACYDKLTKGIIRRGTIVNKNDAIIGKILKVSKNIDEHFQYSDCSIIYKDDEPAIVHNVILDKNEDDKDFCKVVLRKPRPVAIGDKFSVKPTCQILTEHGWTEIQYLKQGVKVATMDKFHTLCYVEPRISSYDYTGKMYEVNNSQLRLSVTKNHKLFVNVLDENNREFGYEKLKLYRTEEVAGMPMMFSHSCKSKLLGIESLYIGEVKYSMDEWISYLGGYLYLYHSRQTKAEIFLDRMKPEYRGNSISVLNALKGATEILPEYVWRLSVSQTRSFLANNYETTSFNFADQMTILALNAEMYGRISFRNSKYVVSLNTRPHTTINNFLFRDDRYVDYSGMVYCVEIPNNGLYQSVFYCRESEYDKPHWTGNSARSGQKGTCGLLLDEADMPRTEDGIAPSIIMNPHGIPTRMTIGQYIESHISNLCSARCSFVDGAIFRPVVIEDVADELKELGLNPYGKKRLYNGITGEFIDCMIFMGPTYYQRLQKFTADQQYVAPSGPSDALTMQPLEGKSSRGGLKLGEMEKDVICAHGSMKLMTEKFNNHSDGIVKFVCRCGKPAIVNVEKNIFKCVYCEDNAEIVAINTTWSSQLFLQEMESMGVGIRQTPDPHIYEVLQ